jgi:uncharacterized protein YdeI (YjbR/CyaY-like superfamily)
MSTTKKGASVKTKAKPEMSSPAEVPIVAFAHERAWRSWLAANHASSRGVWLKLAKKGSGIPSITYPEAIEVALAWGWIDGQKRPFDDAWWLQRFTVRGPKSIWSKINRDKALALIAAGEMKPPGLAHVELAKRDGRWEAAYNGQSRTAVPDDFAAALATSPRAAAFFVTLNAANRYAVLFRIHTAKKAETRAAWIGRLLGMLSRHEKFHP